MGKIWLQTTYGKLIHLPVVGDDINTPDDAVKIPTSVIATQNRCYGQQVVVNIPPHGNVTIDLRPDGISGSCNQCGHCCSHLVADCPSPPDCGWPYNADIDAHTCQYLVIDKKNKWPQAGNTSCSLYAEILDRFKGCAYPPKAVKPEWVNCGYTFA